MASRKRSRASAIFGLLFTTGVLACSSDGDGSQAPPVVTSFGEFSAALTEVGADYLLANAAAFNSVAYFGPFVAGVFPAPPPAGYLASAPTALQTCLPPEVLGVTFDFNDQTMQYEPTATTGAPADGLRLLLYAVQSGSLVTPTQQIGYLDLSCSSDLPTVDMTASLVANAVEVLNINAVGTFNPSTGLFNLGPSITLSTPDGSDQLGYDSNIFGSFSGNTSGVSLTLLGDVSIGYSRTVSAATTMGLASASKGTTELDWTFLLVYDVSGGSVVSQEGSGPAPATFTEFMGVDIIACFSGSESSPTVSDATAGSGCPAADASAVSLSSQELAGLRTAYLALFGLYDVASQFWTVALEILTPSAP